MLICSVHLSPILAYSFSKLIGTKKEQQTMENMDWQDPLTLAVLTVALGTVVAVIVAVTSSSSSSSLWSKKSPTTLPLEDFTEFPLIRKQVLSHDSVRFTFGLPTADHVLGLPTGQHVSLRYQDPVTKKMVQRSYTPVTDDYSSPKGEIGLVIKVYRPAPPKFPDGGKMSQHLDALAIGDVIQMKGPKGHLTWLGKRGGKFTVKPLGKPLQERKCRTIGMMAGGTGITPMLQVLQAIFTPTNPGYDPTVQIKLIYANQTPDDILVQTELETLAQEHPDRFFLHYTVDRTTSKDDWKYSTGFIDKAMIEQYLLFDNRNGQQFFMCGPPPMIKFACLPNLQELGYTEKDWVVF